MKSKGIKEKVKEHIDIIDEGRSDYRLQAARIKDA